MNILLKTKAVDIDKVHLGVLVAFAFKYSKLSAKNEIE